ncbi:MAG: pantetheine-phosphate adenylyltransferase [Armatimonadetes bacterium]|nr:pantetheine-phosphate adenylyltransferase [Armatimonadota bacterium]
MRKAIYPGSFDPVTYGHIDIIERARRTFDHLIVSVAVNPHKTPLFTLAERMEMLQEVCCGMDNVTVDSFTGLLVRYAEQKDAQVIIRGLRAVSDFEYEFQMALMNRTIDPAIETVFMMTNSDYSFLSSSIVQEVARLGGPIQGLVTPTIERRLREKLNQ